MLIFVSVKTNVKIILVPKYTLLTLLYPCFLRRISNQCPRDPYRDLFLHQTVDQTAWEKIAVAANALIDVAMSTNNFRRRC